jgi:hypothetical protein
MINSGEIICSESESLAANGVNMASAIISIMSKANGWLKIMTAKEMA